MAVRIAAVDDKGGVGRTEIIRLLAERCAQLGLNVLCIDMDYQAILSRRMGVQMHGKDSELPNTSDLMQQGVRRGQAAEIIVPCRWQTPWAKNISLMPAHRALWDIEEAGTGKGNPTGRLDRSLEGVDDRFHVTFLDTRPDMGKASQSVWATSDYLLGVTPADTDGAEGLIRLFVEAFSLAEDLGNPDLQAAGVVLNNYSPDSEQVGQARSLQKVLNSDAFLNPIPIFEDAVPRRAYIKKSANRGVPLETYLSGNTLEQKNRREDAAKFIVPLTNKILEVTGVK